MKKFSHNYKKIFLSQFFFNFNFNFFFVLSWHSMKWLDSPEKNKILLQNAEVLKNLKIGLIKS